MKVDQIIEKLKENGAEAAKFFSGLRPEDWEVEMHADGERWTVRQILAHLVEAESGTALLIRQIASGGEGVPENFDLDRYNHGRVMKRESKGEDEAALVDRFLDHRRRTVEMVAGMSASDLKREGRHPFLGISEIGDMLKLMYRHVRLHQRDIRKKLAGR